MMENIEILKIVLINPIIEILKLIPADLYFQVPLFIAVIIFIYFSYLVIKFLVEKWFEYLRHKQELEDNRNNERYKREDTLRNMITDVTETNRNLTETNKILRKDIESERQKQYIKCEVHKNKVREYIENAKTDINTILKDTTVDIDETTKTYLMKANDELDMALTTLLNN